MKPMMSTSNVIADTQLASSTVAAEDVEDSVPYLADIHLEYDDPLLASKALIQLRHSDLPDETLVSVSKGFLQHILQSGM